MGDLMLRIALVVLSVINVAAGVGLAGLYLQFRSDGGVPVLVLLIGISLVVQGGFTLGYLRDRRSGFAATIAQLFVAGESVAALAGIVGTLQGILYNLTPVNGDHEFGPLMAATLMGTQAIIGLIYAARRETVSIKRRA